VNGARAVIGVLLSGCAFHSGAAAVTGGGDAPSDTPVAIIDGAVVDAPGPADAAADATSDTTTHPPNWWDPAWSSRMQLTIVNGSGAALPIGYQIGFAYNLDVAPCAGNRDAARIVRGSTDVARVVDEVGAPQWTWFPLGAAIPAGATSTEYWLYCGNASPSAAPKDPATVFDFFEDFNGTALPAAWTGQNTVTVGGGSVTIGAGNSGIHSNATYGAGVAIDYLATSSQAAADNPYWWGGFQANFSTSPPWVIWHAVSGADQIHPSAYDSAAGWNGTSVVLDTSPHLYGVEHYGDSAAFRVADVIVQTRTYATSLAATSFNLRLHNYQSGGTVSFDWARVRKAVTPAPAVTVGAVETY
jgi:hypothetical protein